LNAGAASTVSLDQDATVRSIVLDAGETLNIDANSTLNLAGTGTTINGVVNSSGTINAMGLTVSGAGARLNFNAGAVNATSITLSTGGQLVVSPGTASKVVRVGALSISTAAGTKLDLGDNKLIAVNGNVGTFGTSNTYDGLTGLIARGRNGGGWGGTGIVTSQSNATSGNFTSIGIATAQQVKSLATASDTAVWGGQTVTGSDALVMYTYGGDANLDGRITVDDYGRIDFNVGLGTAGWYNGDFNYDGKITVDDYGIIDFNVGIQGAPFPTGSASKLSGASAVPEPAGLTVLMLSVCAGIRRRRRR
jgi:hypothetical protein